MHGGGGLARAFSGWTAKALQNPSIQRFGGVAFLYVGAALVCLAALLLTALPSSADGKSSNHGPGSLTSPVHGSGQAKPLAAPAPTAAPLAANPTRAQAQAPRASAALVPPSPGATPSGEPFTTGMPQVGALFGYDDGSLTDHFCSASVVASPAGDLVLTAAHCVYGDGSYTTDIAFVPGYHDGQDPYGVWQISKIVVPQQYMADSDPDYDLAFLTVYQPGTAKSIQQTVGADQLGVNPSYTGLTELLGYPDDTEQPISCTDYTTQFSATQIQIDCLGYPAGTSGGPFLTSSGQPNAIPVVYGVIGGYQTGGDTADISYTCYFGAVAEQLYTQAVAAPSSSTPSSSTG
jgi:V8-like Glu-specific endopeptidase